MSIFKKVKAIGDFFRSETIYESEGSSSKKIYLVSASGMPNYGDDMLTRGWIKYIKRTYPNSQIYLDSVDPTVSQNFFSDVECVNYLWILAQSLGMEGNIADKFSDPIMLPFRERLMLDLFPDIDSFHIIGGGYINDLSGANSRLIEIVSFISEKFQKPCFATGLGLYPLSIDHANKLSSAIKSFSLFDVRDIASFETLKYFLLSNLSFYGDDYFCFPFSENVRLVENEIPTLRLCLNNEAAEHGKAEETLLNYIDDIIVKFSLLHPNGEIVFYEFRPGIDGEVFKSIKERHSHVIFLPFEVLWTKGLTLSSNDYFVSTRFHFQLIVASMGLTGVSFYWNEYYRNKFSSLEVVTNWKSINLDEPSNSKFDLNIVDLKSYTPIFTNEFEVVKDHKLKMASQIYPPE